MGAIVKGGKRGAGMGEGRNGRCWLRWVRLDVRVGISKLICLEWLGGGGRERGWIGGLRGTGGRV